MSLLSSVAKHPKRWLPIVKSDGAGVWLLGYRRRPGSRKAGQEFRFAKPRLLKNVKPGQAPASCVDSNPIPTES